MLASMSPPATPSFVPVVVLGAGLTGLSAALELRQIGIEHRVFEREAWVGGLATTVEDSGFRFDRTGHLLHMGDPELKARVLGWLDEEPFEVERQSVVWSHGVYTRYPFQANTFGLPPRVAYECLLGFLEAHFAAGRPEPENFEEFCLLHFGRGISEHFMLPYNARLWGVPAREINTEWCDRFVPLPRLEDVVAGAVGLGDPRLGYNANFLYPRRGIGELPEAMLRRHGPIELRRRPVRLDWRDHRLHFADESVGYEVLVSTLPLPALVALLDDPPEEVSGAARALRHSRLYYLDVALRAPCRKPLHWVYVPESEYPFYRVGCYSHFSPETAPPGSDHLYVELADRREPDLGRLLPEVATQLVKMGLVGAENELAFARVREIDYAYVIYDCARSASLDTIERFLTEVGILSTGRYGAWNYSSMEDALRFGIQAAARARDLIR
jgi:protoporphyrinogen oxidase